MDPTDFWKIVGVVSYLLVLIGIGRAASSSMNDMKDYFAAGKDLGFWSVAFSARATGESAWLLLGLTGMGATVGVRGLWVVLGEVLGVVGAWLLMARRFNRLTTRYDSLTIPDYLSARFRDTSNGLRLLSAGTLIVFVTIYVSAQIDATGAAFETFLGMNYFLGASVGFGVVMIYSVSGGFKAVVWSDIFQGALMFLGLVGLPIYALYAMGGTWPFVSDLYVIDPVLVDLGGEDGWTMHTVLSTLGLALIGIGFLGSPQIFVRFLALRDPSEVPKGAVVAFIWTLLADSGAVFTGMMGRVILDEPNIQMIGAGAVLGKDGQDVLPLLVESLLPPILVGLFIAIVLSAIMSTVDSLLVLASSAVVRDVYQQVLHPELSDEALLGISRGATLGLGLVAFAVSMAVAYFVPGRTVFWFVVFGWSGIAATFCPVMILSLFWKGTTRHGAMASMVTGFLCVPLFKFGASSIPVIGAHVAALQELPPAFLLAILAGVVVSLFTEPPDVGQELDAASGP